MSGHRANYVQIVVGEARRHGHRVCLATTREGYDRFRSVVTQHDAALEIHTIEGPLATLSSTANLSKSVGAAVTVVLDGDHTLTGLALAGWAGAGVVRVLVMRDPSAPPAAGWRALVRQTLKRTALRVASQRKRVDIVVLGSALRTGPAGRYVPDPIRFHPAPALERELRRRLDGPPGTSWFLIAGAIDARKNVALVLQALGMLALRRPDAAPGLVLAGRLDERVREQIAASGSAIPILVDDRRLTDEELDSYIHLADVVVIAHSNEGPSGILGKAAVAGRRIVAAGALSLREDALFLGRGAGWAALSAHDIADVMEQVLSEEPGWTGLRVGSESNFGRRLVALDSSVAPEGANGPL